MANKILTLDIGVSKATLAEFTLKKGAPPSLAKYATRQLDSLGQDAATRPMDSLSALVRELAAEADIKGGSVSVLLPSNAVFPRPVKIPQADKLAEMVREEAAQNLPFPIEEVVWDYQVVGETPEGESDTLIVATKNENATDAAACAENAGFKLEIIDATPLALYNCVAYNYADADSDCTMVLDMGARTTTLVILDHGKIFVRGINIGGNVITNEIARGLNISPEEAENAKKEIGFVALGGTYAADDETADRISKIIRNVVTRLHSEIARSINFYRVQQGGSAPVKLLITGGSSLTQNMGSFFQEKLQIEVGYLNPFNRVGLTPGHDNQTELLLLAPCVGLAVRAAGAAKINIDLTPPAVLDAQRFSRRLPIFGTSVLFVLCAMVCWVMLANKNKEVYEEQQKTAASALGSIKKDDAELEAAKREKEAIQRKTDYLEAVIRSRSAQLQLWNLVGKSMIKNTWVSSFRFVNEGGDRNDRQERYLHLTVIGYKNEVENEIRNKTTGSAGEYLLARIKEKDKNPETAAQGAEAAAALFDNSPDAGNNAKGFYFDHDPDKTRVERETDVAEMRLIEINLRLKMATNPGEINTSNNLPTDWVAK